MKSIRLYLIATILAAMTLLIFLSALHGYNKSTIEAQHLFDKQLINMANILSASVPQHNTIRQTIISNIKTSNNAFQIWQKNRLISRSDNAPDTLITSLKPGFRDSNFNHFRWRNYVHYIPSVDLWIITAERADIRNRLIDNLIIESALPVIITLPLAALIIWFLVGSGLKPILQLSRQLQQKQSNDLDPVTLGEPLQELQPLINSTNGFLLRLKNAFDREKHFSADAAHELRTPISVLKVALHNLTTELPDNNNLSSLILSVDRMEHLVEQILSLYRTTPDQYFAKFKAIDLYSITQNCIAQQYSTFEASEQQIELIGERVIIQSDAFILETLLKNLLSNANKYTPENGKIEVSIKDEGDDLRLRVEDSGPGIPADKYHRIFDRFYRLNGDQNDTGIEGCGLGLSIVQHIVQLHKADIQLSHSKFSSGLAVTIRFPLNKKNNS